MGRIRLIIALTMATSMRAQTLVDLRTQGKSVDFSASSATRPAKTGTALPATCSTGELYFKTNAPAGQNLYACHAPNSWSLTAAATQSSQLLDLTAFRVSDTQLALASNCSVATPCNVRIGTVTHLITSSATVTLQNGTGTAFIYISAAGALTVGHNLALTCNAGCTAAAAVTAFPGDSIPLASWTAVNGIWDTLGGVDWRAFQSTRTLAAGPGVLIIEAPGTTTVAADPATVGLRVTPPAAATSPCTSGAWAADDSFLYLCHAANTWKRVAIATW